ncbi:glycoside hydrolase family 95 protein [Clostridium cellulovorans]|uniref:Alpha-L-fucosidase n=1 Tax=Clostridium cellulovorans (strain ATCC 35296 / DSM 3052 / OCM 3 / 743B) TaxID=573061 RepID=D9SR72_CLOC7|nr:glycoside hydrolase family 95 protein [Clostridium cellulovorans]ADL50360.1 Alpha-L-fucosidase [Clostridium cellulovorans 743B]
MSIKDLKNSEDLFKLWYDEPAEVWNWDQALPVGNGKLGAMVFGHVHKEQIQLNEESLWSGGYLDRNNPDALAQLPKVRQLLFDGKLKEAERLCAIAMMGTPEHQRHYETLGDLFIDFYHDSDEVKNYRRELDINKAMVTVQYEIDGVNFKREILSSAVDDAIVIRITADKKEAISFRGFVGRELFMDTRTALNDSTVALRGGCGGPDSINYSIILKGTSEGGNLYTMGGNIVVENADAVTLYLTSKTSYLSNDFDAVAISTAEAVSKRTYESILQDHIAEYQSYFSRMTLQLGNKQEALELSKIPTDERLERVKEGKLDDGLISLYFHFGRYLLISCSRPGTLPANLQGIWNKHHTSPWGCKFTININTEMNYWPAETCNLSDCHTPLFDLIEKMREPGRHTAKVMYDCGGFVAHHNVDLWGDTAPQDHWMPATVWPMGAAWLCLHLWEHYEFTCDLKFLKKAYETLKESAEFFVDYLIEDRNGYLVTCPSVSPENTYRLESGETGSLCIGPSMDSQIIYALFSSCIEASELLNTDKEFAETLISLRERLPKPSIGKYGQIMEWAEDYDEVEPGHRHISQLFALHPSNQITVKDTPQLAKAARNTLERRLAHGGGHTGWSRAWIINFWARLEEGEKAYENINALLAKSTLINLLDNHPPFQIDGNFGGAAGVAEMLVQSHSNEINIFPAMPKQWSEGEVTGLCARGGFELSIKWTENKAYVTVTSKAGNRCIIRTPRFAHTSEEVSVEKLQDNVIAFDTIKGEDYHLEF